MDEKKKVEVIPLRSGGYNKFIETLTLVREIITLILTGVSSLEAARKVSKEQGVSFYSLWSKLPENYKEKGD